MAQKARQKIALLEQDIDRARSSKDWNSLPGLVEKHSRETGGESALQFIALGEKALSEEDSSKASSHFEKALNLDPQNGESIAHLGLLKIEEGKTQDALTLLSRLEERKILEGGLTSYGLSKVLLGLETLGGERGKDEGVEKEMEVLKRLLEIAGGEWEKVEGEGGSVEVVERVMVRVPGLYLQMGDVPRSIRSFRSGIVSPLLKKSPETIQKLCQGLAEVLLYKACEEQYPPLDPSKLEGGGAKGGEGRTPRGGGRRKSSGGGENLAVGGGVGYCPKNMYEEGILCLVMAESLLLATPPPLDEQQLKHFRAVGKALTLSYSQLPSPPSPSPTPSPSSNISPTSPASSSSSLQPTSSMPLPGPPSSSSSPSLPAPGVLQRQLIHFQNDASSWFTYGLSLTSSGQHAHSLFAFRQCAHQTPQDPLPYLFAAKVCVNHLPSHCQEAISLSKTAIRLLQAKGGKKGGEEKESLLGKGFEVLGVAYMLCSTLVSSTKEKKEAQLSALDALHNALELRGSDPVVLLYLGLQYAEIRDLDNALRYVRDALKITKKRSEIWVLLALILSAKQLYDKAEEVCDVGLAHHPKHIGLLHIKAKLAQTQECYEGALEGLRKAMQAVREEEDRWEEREGGEDGGMDVRSADDGFLREMAAGGGGGMEGGKKKTRRITTLDNSFDISGEPLLSFKFLSKKERGFELLDLEREVEGGVRRKVDFWVDATEVFLACGDVEGAGVCVKEAQKACPFSADGLACAARVRQVGGKVEGGEVRGMFDRVLRIDEGHVKGKIWLAELCRSNGEHLLAENHLTAVVRKDPTAHQAWSLLGALFMDKGQAERAAECFTTAMQLEATSPVLPFRSVRLFV